MLQVFVSNNLVEHTVTNVALYVWQKM